MAITVTRAPGATFQPVHSTDGDNLTWVLESDRVDYCSMRYVTDLYVNGATARDARVVLSPNASSRRCSFTMNSILADFVGPAPFPGLTGSTAAPSMFGTYALQFGEQDDGTFDCTGTVQTTLGATGVTGTFYYGTLQWQELYNYASFEVDQTSNAGTRFLTNAPRTGQRCSEGEDGYLYAYMAVGGSDPFVLQVDVYTGGTFDSYYVLNNVANAAMPAVVAWPTGVDNLNAAAASGEVLDCTGATFSGDFITCDNTHYTVRLVDTPTFPLC